MTKKVLFSQNAWEILEAFKSNKMLFNYQFVWKEDKFDFLFVTMKLIIVNHRVQLQLRIRDLT